MSGEYVLKCLQLVEYSKTYTSKMQKRSENLLLTYRYDIKPPHRTIQERQIYLYAVIISFAVYFIPLIEYYET